MIEYDAGNNPQRIQFTNGNVTKYVYTPDGRKLRTIHHTAMPNIKVEVGQVHPLTAGEILSSDSIDYMMGGKLITKNGRIDKYLFEGGYCQAIGGQTHLTRPPLILWDDEDSNPSPSDYEQWRKTFESWEAAMKAERERDQFLFYYYNRDHLGNIREVVNDYGNVVQVNNYYPFGSPYCDTSASKAPELQPYKYNGKELDLMHGLNTYDYGACQYNPVVPIWDRVNPLCEKYYNTSPYAYCGNNPVNRVDLKGREWYKKNGYLYWNPKVHSQKDIKEGDGVYIGKDYHENGVFYRQDGTILYNNRVKAMERMLWMSTNGYLRFREQSGYALKDGRMLLMPDNWNDVYTSKLAPGYRLKDGNIRNSRGESFAYIAQLHTHGSKSDKGLSRGSDSDIAYLLSNPNIPVIILHGDGHVYGGYYSGAGIPSSWENDHNLGTVKQILSGTYPIEFYVEYMKRNH